MQPYIVHTRTQEAFCLAENREAVEKIGKYLFPNQSLTICLLQQRDFAALQIQLIKQQKRGYYNTITFGLNLSTKHIANCMFIPYLTRQEKIDNLLK